MKHWFLPGITLFFLIFLVYPLAILLGGAFFIETEEGKVFSLNYFWLVFENPFYRECFFNSLLIAVLSTIACLFVAVPMAYALQRYEFPGKTVIQTAVLLPLILPPFVGAIGLQQFFSRFGSINLVLMELGFISPSEPIDWFGSGGFVGIILLETLHLYPIMLLSVQAALANLDPSLRDAAQNLGAKGFHIFKTVTLPLAFPGIFAGASIVFVSAFTDLGVPLMFNFQTTIPTQIFNLVTEDDDPTGYALVVLTLILVSVLFLIGKKVGEGNYSMLARSATYDDVVRLGPLSGWLMTGAIGGFILFSLLPHAGVVVQSFAVKWFDSPLPTEWSGDAYGVVFSLPLTSISIQNSLMYAVSSAVLDLVLGVVIAFLLAREKFWGRQLLDMVAMLPLALPGLVLAFAYYVAFSDPWIGESFVGPWLNPKNNPFLILVVAYSVQRLPYIVRAAYAGLQQTSVSLEEASANLGATPLQTMWRISLPLISANVIAGTILTFSFAMLDVSNGMILAQEASYFPVTKAIYMLMGLIMPTAPAIACALGVLAMALLGVSLFIASRLLGQKMGQLFRS